VRATYPVAAVITVVALVVLAIVLALQDRLDTPEVAGPATETTPPAAEGKAPALIGRKDERAGFDVVRVAPDGRAVIAGRTAPGAEVTVRAGEQVIGTVTADRRGEWVLVPEQPLASGALQVEQDVQVPGEQPFTSEEIVVVVVPERAERAAEAPEQAIVLRTPGPGGASELLQGPVETAEGSAGLSLETADYDDTGRVALSGVATPGSAVRAYLDNQEIAVGRADAAGTWNLEAKRPLAPGDQALRIDQLDDEGRVVMRLEVPFRRALLTELPLAAGVVIVQPGTNLWRIARSIYGEGLQYTMIYRANRDQIRDPDLIYPGQIFTIPGEEHRE
jgi:nucleoid-associated protein YgaU